MPLRIKYRVGTTGVFHTPGHFLVFLATSILLCRTVSNFNHRLLRWVGVCVFAVVMEVLEWVAYHNAFEWRDVFVDISGAGLGLLVVSLWRVRSHRGAEQQKV